MNHMAGFLIRQERLKQNISQEGLCKGICVVSYLSKIEQGKVSADPAIIEALFKELHITYCQDQAFIDTYKKALYTYYEQYFLQGCKIDGTAISLQADTLYYSPLCLDIMLFNLYNMPYTSVHLKDQILVERRLKKLSDYIDMMNDSQLFLYHMAYIFLDQIDMQILHLQKAVKVNYCCIPFHRLGDIYFEIGDYSIGLKHYQTAFQLANDNCLYSLAADAMQMMGNCYANLGMESLMLSSYEKAQRAFQYLQDEKSIKHISYNLGATFQSWGKSQLSIPYLLASIDDKCSNATLFMIYHKLALAYQDLNMLEDGHKALANMKDVMQDLHEDGISLLYEVAKLRYESDVIHIPEYQRLLEEICLKPHTFIYHGIKQYHAQFLIEVYIAKRKYKEAFQLLKEWNEHVFPRFADL